MAVVRDPLAKARAVKTERQAARLWQELDVELALNDDLTPDWEEQAEAAQAELERRYTRADLEDPSVSQGPDGQQWMASASAGAKKGLSTPSTNTTGGPARAGAKRPALEGGRARQPSTPRQRERAARYRRGRRPAARRARRYWRQTGVPQAGASFTRGLMQLLGLLLFLSLLYLLLTNAQRAPRGRAAIEQAAGGLQRLITLLIAPVDPLRPSTPGVVLRDRSGTDTSGTAGGDPAGRYSPSVGHPRTPTRPRRPSHQ